MHSNKIRLVALTGAATSVLLVLACSGGAGTVGGGAPVQFDQLGKAYADKICAAIQTCCNQNGFGDVWANCAQAGPALQAQFEKDKAKHPDYTYDAQKAGNCIAKIAGAFTSCDPKNSDIGSDTDCEGFFRGSKPAGASCTSSTECAAPLSSCSGASATSSPDGGIATSGGVCITRKVPSEGDPCLTYGAGAAPNASTVYGACDGDSHFYCDSTSKTCKARGGVGTICIVTEGSSTTYNSQACAEGTTCDSSTKACIAAKGVGDDCSSNGTCGTGAYCDYSGTKKCVAQKNAGEACTGQTANECAHGCDSTTKKCRVNSVSQKTCAGNLD